MDMSEVKIMQNPSVKPHRYFTVAQFCLRFLAAASTLAAALTIFTSNQSALVFGIKLEARYTYSSALKFFVYANVIACAMSVLTCLLSFVLGGKFLHHNCYFYMFLHDLVVMSLSMAASAAATAIGYVGKYGNSHTGWTKICDDFSKFCSKLTVSIILSYFSFFFYFCLAIISANKSRHIH